MSYLIYCSSEEKEALELQQIGEISIGRTADNHIRILNDNSVSRKHCLIKLNNGEAIIEDLGSSNGTSVNNTSLSDKPVKLNDGDIIQIGNAKFLFCYEDFEKYVEVELPPIQIEVRNNFSSASHSDKGKNELEKSHYIDTLCINKDTLPHYAVSSVFTPDSFTIEKGTEIEGGYRIIRDLGSGPHSKTFLAYQKSVDRTVVLKFFKIKQDCNITVAFESFRQELFKTTNVSDNGLIHYFDCGSHHRNVFLSMPYLSEGPLIDFIRRNGKSPVEQALPLIINIAQILNNILYEANLLHLSINPSNVMFNDNGNITLTDYGFKMWKNEYCLCNEVNIWSRYESPELKKGEVLTHLSDIYSLGVLFYEMLTGILDNKNTFDPKTSIQNLKVDNETRDVLRLMTEPSPQLRVQSYESLLKILNHLQKKYKQDDRQKLKIRPLSYHKKVIIKKKIH